MTIDILSGEGVVVEGSAEGEHEVEEEDGVQSEEDDEEDVIQFAMGNHAVVQGAWATGFSSPGRTWPGHLIRFHIFNLIV